MSSAPVPELYYQQNIIPEYRKYCQHVKSIKSSKIKMINGIQSKELVMH